MNEAEMQSKFTGWLKSAEGLAWVSGMGGCLVMELKVAKGGTLGFGLIREHQMIALAAAGGHGIQKAVIHKISDMGAGLKPFDCFAISGGRGILVVGFNGGRDWRWFEVDAWMWLRYMAWRAGDGKDGLKIEDGELLK